MNALRAAGTLTISVDTLVSITTSIKFLYSFSSSLRNSSGTSRQLVNLLLGNAVDVRPKRCHQPKLDTTNEGVTASHATISTPSTL